MQLEVISLMELPFSSPPPDPSVPTFTSSFPFLPSNMEQQSKFWVASYGNALQHLGSLRTRVTSVKSQNSDTQSNRDMPFDRQAGNGQSLPTEDAKDEVEHEEGSDDDERDEEDPVESVPKCIVGLQ